MIAQQSLRFGLILSAISIAIVTILFMVEMNLMLWGLLFLVYLIVLLVLWVVYAIKVRKKNNNVFSYKEALISLVIIATVSMSIGQIWGTIYPKYIDKNFIERTAENAVEGMVEMGLSPDDPQIEETVKQIEESGDFSIQMKKFAINLVVMLVLSLIIAAIIKKDDAKTHSPSTIE